MGENIIMGIEIINLTKSFDDKIVLKDLSVEFPKGQITAIMGTSGCGKTTLLHIIMGIMEYEEGNIKGNGGKKSAVFQEDRLCMNLSAAANIKLVNEKLTIKKIEENMKKIGLEGCLHLPVRELSGGMKRRIAILRAILSEYEILFLDEPFQGLDEDTKNTVIDYIKEKVKGKTVLMVTHDIEEAEKMDANIFYL